VNEAAVGRKYSDRPRTWLKVLRDHLERRFDAPPSEVVSAEIERLAGILERAAR
jgi:hypothetical protein